MLVACLVIGLAGGWRSQATWTSAVPRHLGDYSGWATVVGDPAPFGSGLRVTIEIEGERFDAWVYGSPRRRLVDRQAGELVYVQGERRVMISNVRRAQIRHVVGRFETDVVGDWSEGSPLYRTASRVRSALRGVAESTMDDDDAALFTGLVIGDDAREPVEMITAFRASGLSHLTAVSGENVVFLIAAASPVLRRLRPWWRWATTLGLIGWFMALTRFEPSVLRAGNHGHARQFGVRAGAPAIGCATARMHRRDPGAGRPDAGVVGRVLAVDRRHSRGVRRRATAGSAPSGATVAARPAVGHPRCADRCRPAELARVPSSSAGRHSPPTSSPSRLPGS